MITLDLSNKNIKSAKYGILNKYIDVLTIMNKLIINNHEKIIVNNRTFKKDPYYGKVKELVLVFSNASQLCVKDGNTINIINNSIYIKKTDMVKNMKQINNNSNGDYILATFVKNENNIIEWIIYHLLIGFDKILIIDNNSHIPVRNIIKNYKFKDKIDIIDTNKTGIIKEYFLNDIILPYMKQYCSKYFIHLDVDEYINLNDNYNNVDELLNDYPVDVLVLNKLIFGSNNLKTNTCDYKGLIPTYTKCATNIIASCCYFININSEPEKYVNNGKYAMQDLHIKINKKRTYKYISDNYNKSDSIYDIPAIINNYAIQSFIDYNKRNIYRTKIDHASCHKFNNTILTKFNEITYDNLNKKYSQTIKYVIDNDIITIGFIILRYVNSEKTNQYWQECYDHIRRFYKNKIIIIDDNSDPKYLTNDKELVNCHIINSEYPQRGELLPYYYYYHNMFCDRLIVLHDTMFIKKYIDFTNVPNYNNFTRIFSFGIKGYNIDIEYFKEQTTFLKHGNEIYQFHLNNKNNMLGCLGVAFIIDHSFLVQIQEKYNILNLVNCIKNREYRKTLERVLSCLFEKEMNDINMNTRYSLLGDIHKNINRQKIDENSVYIKKIFTGR